MKALSMTQPWAQLVAIGAKQIETRSWGTSYRGPLAIQAAKGFPEEAQWLCGEPPFDRVLLDGGFEGHWVLPRGAIVAVAELTDCLYTNQKYSIDALLRSAPPHERAFGDFSTDRYAWVFRNVQALKEPVPCRGYPSVWPVDADLEARIRAQLRKAVKA